MDARNEPQVIAADCDQGGVSISFNDGSKAFYSGYLLHAALALAAIMQEEAQVATAGFVRESASISNYS